MMSPAQKIIDFFGGNTALARLLGHKHQSTVEGWRRRGIIPALQQNKVLSAARLNKINITPDDFFDPPPPQTNSSSEQAP